MKKILQQYKPQIDDYLEQYLAEVQQTHHEHYWARDVFSRLEEVMHLGKTIRGSLVMVTCAMLGSDIPKTALPTAAALELIHLSFLIQDDIQDRDDLRRGHPTTHIQYEQLGAEENMHDAQHFGYGMAGNISMLCSFLGFDILSKVSLPTDQYQQLVKAFSGDLIGVAFAQMHDLYGGMGTKPLNQKDILQIAHFKTARYTFSLPFAIAGILTNQSEEDIVKLEKLGEYLGTIFQIKDDELGLFGDEQRLGKPVGSDIAEGKQTLFYYHLFDAATNQEKEKLNTIFGNSNITHHDIEYVRGLITQYTISGHIHEYIEELKNKSLALVPELPFTQESQAMIPDMIDYLITRVK